jgi:uncharacterized membrane protein YkvA (DUF1232 family)
MTDQQNPPPNKGVIQKFFDRLALSWRLIFDRRVDANLKLIPPLAILYILSPIDLMPEIILGPLGVVDDVGVAILALETFIRLAPSDVVKEHLRTLQKRFYDSVDLDETPSSDGEKPKRTSGDTVIDGQYRVKEDER